MAPGPLVRSGQYLAIAYEFIGALMGGALVGWAADLWLGISPWGLVVGLFLGLAGGLLRLVQMARRLERLDRRPEC